MEIKENVITATGALGTLSYVIPEGITPNLEGAVLTFSIPETRWKELNALHGTTRANVSNIIEGVTTGFTKVLEINGLGYRANVAGQNLIWTWVSLTPSIWISPPALRLRWIRNPAR